VQTSGLEVAHKGTESDLLIGLTFAERGNVCFHCRGRSFAVDMKPLSWNKESLFSHTLLSIDCAL